MNILILSGTDRHGSNAERVSRYVAGLYSQQEGINAKVVSLSEYPLASLAGGPYKNRPDDVIQFNEPFMQADGIVFVVPEYNGSFPGILKLFIDHLPFPDALKDRPVAFIGEASGYFGGLRAVEHLQMVAAYRYAVMFPERVFIPAVHKEFDPEHGLSDPLRQSLLVSQCRHFPDFIRRHRAGV